jgi:hypothetical protein
MFKLIRLLAVLTVPMTASALQAATFSFAAITLASDLAEAVQINRLDPGRQ